MNKHVKFLLVIAVIAAMFSSCKKSTDTSILEGHKWTMTANTETYSDSAGVSHNLIPVNTTCQSSSYTQFETNAANAVLKLAYTYSTTNCTGTFTLVPEVGVTSWNIDPNNTVLYLNGSSSDGSGGTWFNIQSISSSTIVLTIVTEVSIGTTGPPNYTAIYHNVTETWTYTAK